ncbi:overexpressed in colon carcinoma 1 protein isoform X2 [Mixophyes fleayi]|uniref:overexpressed in colon carcinoma 1 protein isoform X2 n=1 Tax=Mixophyes fleayi TaxID=3061075 RepID=UPI003F4D9210
MGCSNSSAEGYKGISKDMAEHDAAQDEKYSNYGGVYVGQPLDTESADRSKEEQGASASSIEKQGASTSSIEVQGVSASSKEAQGASAASSEEAQGSSRTYVQKPKPGSPLPDNFI